MTTDDPKLSLTPMSASAGWLAPCWACILSDDDCERQYVELAVTPDAGEAHGKTFAMTFEPENAQRIGLDLVRRARALAVVPLVQDT